MVRHGGSELGGVWRYDTSIVPNNNDDRRNTKRMEELAVESVAISVPKDWTVAFNNPGCSTGAPGLLALETSPQEVEICPNDLRPTETR